jgi:hypothetical protein
MGGETPGGGHAWLSITAGPRADVLLWVGLALGTDSPEPCVRRGEGQLGCCYKRNQLPNNTKAAECYRLNVHTHWRQAGPGRPSVCVSSMTSMWTHDALAASGKKAPEGLLGEEGAQSLHIRSP